VNQLPYLLPWVRVALLIRSIRTTTFDEATWPTAKTVLARALAMAEPAYTGELVAHGDTAFTVPLLDQYLRRAIPDWRPPKVRRR
jgi:hypothetical protein